jgi:hypothetical protein
LNSIRIYNPNDYTPDFDRIVVYWGQTLRIKKLIIYFSV